MGIYGSRSEMDGLTAREFSAKICVRTGKVAGDFHLAHAG
jgi:hypothetical protein